MIKDPVIPIVPAFPTAIKYQHSILKDILWDILDNLNNEVKVMELGYKFTDLSIEHIILEGNLMYDMEYPYLHYHNIEHWELIRRDSEILNLDSIGYDDILDIMNRWDLHMFLVDKPMEEWVQRNRKRFLVINNDLLENK
jgi:hemerythrin